MTDKKSPMAAETNDFDFDFDDKPTITEQDIKAANNMRENIKKQNIINEKEVEKRAIAQAHAKAQYDQFKQIIDDIYEPSSSTGGSNLLYQLANEMELLNGKTFWSYAQAEGKRTKIEEIQYCTWAVLEISKAPIEDRLKVLIMEAINSYIGEMAHGKISWRIALSL
ncbi:hypothetical protein [Pseudomonas hormoni]